MSERFGPAEYCGEASHDAEGWLTIGEPPNSVRIKLHKKTFDIKGWWNTGTVGVYVRRIDNPGGITDGEIVEILMAQHDGLSNESEDANPSVAVCPSCDGDGCDECTGWGLVPIEPTPSQWDDITQQGAK